MTHERTTSSRTRQRIRESLYREAALLAKYTRTPVGDAITFCLADALIRARQRRLASERELKIDGQVGADGRERRGAEHG